MSSPNSGDKGPLNRPPNTDFNETVQFSPTGSGSTSQSKTIVQAGILLNDRYLIIRELSSGGFGKVFLAQDQQLHNRLVVVKIQLDHPIDDPWFEKKFSEELRALALIDHPGVVGALDSARTPDGRPFLVMQYVEGVPLRQVINSDGMPLDRAANIIRQIGQALGAAHEKGIWHRDLKPENIMLQVLPGGDEHVRLIDFGLATIADMAAKQQSHTRIAGSPGYMAPEQLSGQPSAATDIYAFGVIAYEMITGRKPFVAEDVMQLSMLQRSGVKVKPSALRPGISSLTERLILHALHYNPDDRPASAGAYGDALSQALLQSRTNPSIVVPPEGRHRFPIAWIAGGIVVLALAGGAFWIARSRGTSASPEKPATTAAAVPAATPAPQQPPPSVPDDAVELAFWNSIGSSNDPRLYREYLAKYPNGKFASLAKLKLQAPAPPSPPPPGSAPAPPPAKQSGPDVGAIPEIPNVIIPGMPKSLIPMMKGQPFAAAPTGPLPDLRPALQPEEYAGRLRGDIAWSGTLDAGATLTIQGGKPNSGVIIGDLPRVPASVTVLGKLAAVMEQPSAANQFDRVVIKNTSGAPVRGMLIQWRVVK